MNYSEVCPLLLNPAQYNPDTLNLTKDTDARKYWFNCFIELVKKFSKQAAKSQSHDPLGNVRASRFQSDFIQQMNTLISTENQNEPVTIRKLLDLNETCLRLNGFPDPWSEQKKIENSAALNLFKNRIDELDMLESKEKWLELFRGFLAGNIFDWGAQAVSEMLENNNSFGLHEALSCIQNRPWLIDGYDQWLQRIEKHPPHNCAVIFADNSGVDIVLGVIPFARELLMRQTKVILCANTEPALNDVTYNELVQVIQHCCKDCDVLRRAYERDDLLLFSNGQHGPCLDLTKLTPELCEAMLTNRVDLLIIEGMGRALHTNFNATFNCESLKLAVIKNEWLAHRLGGDTFSVVCKYESI